MRKSNWLIIADELSKLKFSTFYQTKKGMIKPTCSFFNKIKSRENRECLLEFIRCDNAGKNQALNQHINRASYKLNLEFKCTKRATPQQNSLAETSFTTISNKAKTIMVDANALCLQ